MSLKNVSGQSYKVTIGTFGSSLLDKQDARKPLDFDLLRISPEFLIDQNNFYHSFHKLLYNIL